MLDMTGMGEETDKAELQMLETAIGVVGSGGWDGLM
jgi:hypothetical protein